MFGAILTGLEAIAFAATIQSAAEKEIFQAKIEHLKKSHEKELTVMSHIYELCEKLYFQEGLLDQLHTTKLYTVQQWQLIGKSMNNQIDLINDFMKKFKEIQLKQADIKTDWLNTFVISIYSLGFIEKGWKVYRHINPAPEPTPRLEIQMTEGWHLLDSQNITSSISRLNSSSSIEMQEVNSSSSSSTLSDIESNMAVNRGMTRSRFQTLKDWGKEGLKFIAQHGVRLLFLAFSVINLYRGRLDINELKDIFKNAEQFFKKNGEFEKKQDTIAVALLTIAANVYSLVNISYSAVKELHSVYLTRSAVESVNANYYFVKAADMVPEKFGLTSQFFKQCKKFLDDVSTSSSSGKKISERLEDMEKIFTPFIEKGTVSQVFQNVIQSFSQSVATDAVLSKSLHEKQMKFTSLLKITKNEFEEKRGKDFDQKPLSEKERIDLSLLKDLEIIYKEIILEDPSAKSGLNLRDELTIVQILSNFCTRFYATDPSGQTVYKYNIADNRSKQRYADLLNDISLTNPQGRVPIKLENEVAEKEQQRKMVDLAKKVNAEKKVIPGQFSLTINDIEFRYTRVTVQTNGNKNSKGEPLSSTIGSEGAQFLYQGSKYEVEQELISKKASLTKL